MRSEQFLLRCIFATTIWGGCMLPVQGAEPKTVAVTESYSFMSLNNVQADLRYLFESAGIPEKARTIDALAMLFTSGYGADAIDRTKPFGLAADKRHANGFYFVFIPVENQDDFVKLLRTIVPEIIVTTPDKPDESIEGDFVVHFHHGYAYLYSGDRWARRFPNPAAFIPAQLKDFDFVAAVNITASSEQARNQWRERASEWILDTYQYCAANVRHFPENKEVPAAIQRTIAESDQFRLGFRISPEDRASIITMIATPAADKKFSQFSAEPVTKIDFRTDHLAKLAIRSLNDMAEFRERIEKALAHDRDVEFHLTASQQEIRAQFTLQEAYQRMLALSYGATFEDLIPAGMIPNSLVMPFLFYFFGPPDFSTFSNDPLFEQKTGQTLQNTNAKVLVICSVKTDDKTAADDILDDLSPLIISRLKQHHIKAFSADDSTKQIPKMVNVESRAKAGKAHDADYVITIQIADLSMREVGKDGAHRGSASVAVDVVTVENGKQIFAENADWIYPLRGPVSTEEIPPARFQTLALSRLAEFIGAKFYSTPVADPK